MTNAREISLADAGDGALELLSELLWPQFRGARETLRVICEPWHKAIKAELRRRKRRPDAMAIRLRAPARLSLDSILLAAYLLGRFVQDTTAQEAQLAPAYSAESYEQARGLARAMVATLQQAAHRNSPQAIGGTVAPPLPLLN